MNDQEIPLMSHLRDLRVAFIRIILGLVITSGICYFFIDFIMLWLRQPMLEVLPESAKLVVLSPQEYFFTELKAAFFFGAITSAPWAFTQIWLFVAPGLYKHEKKMLSLFVVAASFCFVAGTTFAYFLVFPPTFQFFIETLPTGVSGSYSIGMLYGFAITVLMAFGVAFQTPIAVFLLVVFDLISIETFKKSRAFVLVGAFIVGAILTPPDPITQVMLALPAYALFECGLLCARIFLQRQAVAEKNNASLAND